MPDTEARARGLPATPAHDLRFRGGKLIPHLEYLSHYVGGAKAWSPDDVRRIDGAIEAAMKDPQLENVMVQYFPGGGISTRFLGSRILSGSRPRVMSQGDVEALARQLSRTGKLKGLDLKRTVLNFMLPSGTILTTDPASSRSRAARAARPARTAKRATGRNRAIPHEEEDSTEGLGGYHGSIHIGSGSRRKTIYYAVGAFSEILPDGTENGIVAFDQPWKNVVATFYHELNEVRTDPDVEDAIRAGDDPAAVSLLGWTSDQGEECGDFPVFEARPLSQVFKEVPLASGGGRVPIQLQYSNAVHGPEGPIARPHPVRVGAT